MSDLDEVLTTDQVIVIRGRKAFIPARADKAPTCDTFLSSLGIGQGPYATDGTASYCHDEKLHPNNAVASNESGK